MMRTEGLRRQHDAALVLATDVKRRADRLADRPRREDADALMPVLADLTDMLRRHFRQEDHQLYPVLLASDRAVAIIARRFVAEMGHIGPLCADFVDYWRSADIIMDDVAGFHREVCTLYKALADRIHRENTQLYPLADSLADEGSVRAA